MWNKCIFVQIFVRRFNGNAIILSACIIAILKLIPNCRLKIGSSKHISMHCIECNIFQFNFRSNIRQRPWAQIRGACGHVCVGLHPLPHFAENQSTLHLKLWTTLPIVQSRVTEKWRNWTNYEQVDEKVESEMAVSRDLDVLNIKMFLSFGFISVAILKIRSRIGKHPRIFLSVRPCMITFLSAKFK